MKNNHLGDRFHTAKTNRTKSAVANRRTSNPRGGVRVGERGHTEAMTALEPAERSRKGTG